MFDLTIKEYSFLSSQIGTLKQGKHSKYSPMAFTEQGIAILSGVLNSSQAISVNIISVLFIKITNNMPVRFIVIG
jgi:hypothetical protein